MRLCDGIVAFLPGPSDLPPVKATTEDGREVERAPTPDAPVCALAFKTVHDKTGDLTFLRVYSGTLRRGESLWNSRKHKQERIGRLLVMKADEREAVDEARAGEIVAAIGLKEASTGDTLCTKDEPISLEDMDFPEAVISVAIEPKSRGDRDKLGEVLANLTREDPSLRHYSDPETGDTVLAGMGELHLEVVVNRIRSEFKIPTEVGAPRVAYRLRLRKDCDVEGKHVKQSGGRGQFAVVNCRFGVGEEQELDWTDSVVGGNVPREYIPAVRKGIEQRARSRTRPRASRSCRSRPSSTTARPTAVDSSEMAFASRPAVLAFRNACREGRHRPCSSRSCACRSCTPSDFMGDVIGSINARRAEIEEIKEGKGNFNAGHRPGPALRDVQLRHEPAVDDHGPRHLLDGAGHLRAGPREPRPGGSPRGQGSPREEVAGKRIDKGAPPRGARPFFNFVSRASRAPNRRPGAPSNEAP